MLTRRGFLGWAAGALPVAILVRAAHAASIEHLGAAPQTLDALGEAILPSELSTAERARVVAGFRRWMEGYRENAELLHGYGNSRVRLTGPTPATRWTKQLDDLDAAARISDGKAFSALSVARRQAVARPLLAAERAGMAPSPDGAVHVAAGLLAFFYSSAAATDLCYEAAIGKNQCRPLAQSSRHPLPRAKSSSGRALPIRTDVEAGS